MRDRRLRLGLLAATLLLGGATIGLASVPPRPLRSALTVVYTLSFRVAADWLVVVALLGVAERYVSGGRAVDRAAVGTLAALVFLGGLAIEAAPFARLVVEPSAVGLDRLVRGVVAAVQGALFPTALFVATVVGAATLRDGLTGRAGLDTDGGLPLSPSVEGLPRLRPAAVWQAVRVLAIAAGAAFALEVAARFALGDPYPLLTLADAAIAALADLGGYVALAVAFLVLAVDGVRVRSLVGGVVCVWAAAFGLSLVVALLGALLGVGLVGGTVTPMAAVEASTLGGWPSPDSWALLLRLATFLAAGVGLLAIQGPRRDPGTGEAEAAASDPSSK